VGQHDIPKLAQLIKGQSRYGGEVSVYLFPHHDEAVTRSAIDRMLLSAGLDSSLARQKH
jgi:hypothetical protein